MKAKTKILIVEHDKIDLELLRYELKKGKIDYVSEIVQTESDYTNALVKFIPDIILSDFSFPAFDGLTAFRIKENISPDTPFIFVTGTIGEEKSIELIKNGVTDYILKDRLFTLVVKVNRALKEAEVKKRGKKIEEQKEFDRNNLNALINNTEDLMWSIDKNFNLITSNQPFNDSMKLLTGHEIEKGSDVFASGYSPDRLIRYKLSCGRAFAGEVFTEVEYANSPVEGWSEISYYPIRSGNEILGTACHSRDITDRKKIALLLEQQNQELIKTNSELDRFVYSTSHDLRSPLSSVLGLVNIIEKETKESHTLIYSNMIRTSVDRLDEFIKNILSYSQNNHTELEPVKIPVQELTDHIVERLRNMKGADEIKFEVNIDELMPFYSDERRFRTILENLISNAVKYHKNGVSGKYIKITGSSDTENLHLNIEDNGIGISPKHHDKIFDMFYRVPGKAAGTGFGLYIVKENVEKLQGSLTLKSNEETGTSFNIKIKNFGIAS